MLETELHYCRRANGFESHPDYKNNNMTSEDLTWTPTSVTIVVEGKEYMDYKPGMEWIVYALEFFRLSKLHEESIKLIK
jgi:hypothetical protein